MLESATAGLDTHTTMTSADASDEFLDLLWLCASC